jgi:hypothetical protein
MAAQRKSSPPSPLPSLQKRKRSPKRTSYCRLPSSRPRRRKRWSGSGPG